MIAAPKLHATWRGVTLVVRPLRERVPGELSRAERALVRSAGSDARRRELRAGRLVAHLALRAAGVKGRVEVLRAAAGQPALSKLAGWHLSLSHGGALVAAVCARRRVGVDVVALARVAQIERVVEGHARAVAPGTAALVWTAWEALGKVSGEGVLSETRTALQPRRARGGFVARVGARRLRWWTLPGHLVCVAVLANRSGR